MHPTTMSDTDKYRSKGCLDIGSIKRRRNEIVLNPLESALAIIIPNCMLALPQKMEDRLAYVYQSGNETTDLSLSPQSRHVKYGSDLFEINLYTKLTDDVS